MASVTSSERAGGSGLTPPSIVSLTVAKVNVAFVGFSRPIAYVTVEDCPHCKLICQTTLPFIQPLCLPFQFHYSETSITLLIYPYEPVPHNGAKRCSPVSLRLNAFHQPTWHWFQKPNK